VLQMSFGFGFSSMRVCAILILICIVSTPAFADGKITISYSISYLGVTVGSADWRLSLVADRYDIEASAQIKGLMSVLVDGQGSGHARGVVSNGRAIPSEFEAHVVTSDETDTIRMTLQNGAVRQLVALPPFPPIPERVPLSAASLQGVIDPLSASLIPDDTVGGNVGDQCKRALPVFDGRHRYDVGLSFKETREVSIPGDAAAQILVCRLLLTPLAGHQVKSPILHYLVKGQEIEVSLKPIGEAHIAVPVGAAIPMLVGTLHVESEHISIEMSDLASGAGSATRR
jgi:hypothetical protein